MINDFCSLSLPTQALEWDRPYDENNTKSITATIDEEFVAESSNYTKVRALYLVKKMIDLD